MKSTGMYFYNVDENYEYSNKYGIRSIPALLFFKDGEVVNTINNHSMDFMDKGYRESLQVLEDAGVYKRTAQGMEAFERFIKSI